MAKYAHGEWMQLYVDGDFNFIRGHFSQEESQLIATEALRKYESDPGLEIEVEKVIHKIGRFGIAYDECGEQVSWLYLDRPEGESGSFPVTEVHYTVQETQNLMSQYYKASNR